MVDMSASPSFIVLQRRRATAPIPAAPDRTADPRSPAPGQRQMDKRKPRARILFFNSRLFSLIVFRRTLGFSAAPVHKKPTDSAIRCFLTLF
jgi:hypothetical protein